jgi:Uma2 family endonuclease
MAETDLHRILMMALIQALEAFFAGNPLVYVSGNLFVFYEKGNRLRHLTPDIFVVRGVPKRRRDHYLIWEERKGPEFIIELTSASTRDEDVDDKFVMYRDLLKVSEYFLFDPYAEHLKPPMQGYRLYQGQYVAIPPVEGRLPSDVIGMHLERSGNMLRLWNPATGLWLPTPEESAAQSEIARQQAETARLQAEMAYRQAEAEREHEALSRRQAEAEIERLRRELEDLRRQRQGCTRQ